MSGDKHTPSTTLDDIITELKLTYDPSVGLLDGDAIREIPNVNTLTNLSKLLSNLSRELNDVEVSDRNILKNINNILDNDKKRPHKEIEDDEEEAEAEEEDVDVDKEEDADFSDEEAISSHKRRKIKEIKSNDDDTNTINATEVYNVDDEIVPPVQKGHFTQDNDTRLKNPKSEFVKSQTLSKEAVAELGLFSEDNNGLETQGKEYLKKKYGVASYPESDLQDLLPGKIPDIDFSKTKPPNNQVQFTTFQSYVESYFRPFSNQDLEFLQETNIIPPGFGKDYDSNINPFIIPKLGRLYSDVWAEEDATLGSKLNSPAFHQPSFESYQPKGSIDEVTDETLHTEDVSVGPLSSRLLSAILSTNEVNNSDDELKENAFDAEENIKFDSEDIVDGEVSVEDYKVTTDTPDFHSLEERLKRELKYIGIFMNLPNSDEDRTKNQKTGRMMKKGSIIDNDEWIINREDDEICAEIRDLQKELKASVKMNRENRKKLIPLVEEQIAYQEYCTILEDLDKQVDQAYLKRLKAKSKKKKSEAPANTSQQEAFNTGLRALLEKRTRWIENIGILFKPAEIMKRIPLESILDQVSNEPLDDDENTDNATTGTDLIIEG
jgi:transcriptional adapter 3